MSAFSLPTAPRSLAASASTLLERFPTAHLRKEDAPIASAHCLSPDHFRREFARWVSYYALFKWWLPLSQHPHCLSEFTSFSTEQCLGALADGLGCFPLDYEAYPPQSDCRASPDGIRSLIEFSTLVWALAHSVLYLRRSALDAIPQYISERTSYHRV